MSKKDPDARYLRVRIDDSTCQHGRDRRFKHRLVCRKAPKARKKWRMPKGARYSYEGELSGRRRR